MKRRFFIKNLSLFLIPFLIPTILLGTLSVVITRHNIQSEIRNDNLNLLYQIEQNISLIFNEIDSLAVSLGDIEVVYRLEEILKTQQLTLQDLRLLGILRNVVSAPANSKPYIESIYVYIDNQNGHFLNSMRGLTKIEAFYDRHWVSMYEQSENRREPWAESRVIQRYDFEKPIRVTTIYKNLFSTVDNQKKGMIVLNINTDYIENALNNLESGTQHHIVILNENDQILFQNRRFELFRTMDFGQLSVSKDNMFTLRNDQGIYFINQLESDMYGLRYVLFSPSAMYQLSSRLSAVTICVVFVSFILGLTFTYVLTRKNVNRIRDIISTIKAAEKDLTHLSTADHRKQEDEYSYIIQRILTNYIEQKNLQLMVSENKYKLKEAELSALQNQINPHFLFNTMETIYWKVISYTKKPNEANRMIENLSDMLKYSLKVGSQIVPLEKELTITRNYIEIQKVRYRDQFEVIFDYDEEIKQHGVIKFLLQPLIENSIYHGIKESERKCFIKIKINQSPTHLQVAVIDNGKGMDKVRLTQVRQRLLSLTEEPHDGHSIGLDNINKRLQLVYGEAEPMSIKSKAGWGTVILTRIPL